jgi:hypothetical protein
VVIGCETRNPQNLKVWPIDSPTHAVVTRKGGEDVEDVTPFISIINAYAAKDEREFIAREKAKKTKQVEESRYVISDDVTKDTPEINALITKVVGKYQHIPGTRSITIEGQQYILPPTAFERISIKQLRKYLPQSIIDKAVHDELVGNMEGKQVWKYVPYSEARKQHVIRSMIFLKVKEKGGQFDKLKARLVCDGSNQSEEQFDRTSSPTVDYSSLLLILSLVKYLDAKIATVDVPAAFLNSKLKEKIYMMLDADVSRVLVENDPNLFQFLNDKGQLIVLLLMCLYGLKQAGAEWFMVLSTFIVDKLNYTQSKADRCVFFKFVNGRLHILIIHVDDLLITYTCEKDYQRLKQQFIQMFGTMTFIEGNEHHYLGLEIKILKDKSVFINQTSHLMKVIKSYVEWRVNMDPQFKLKPYITPSVPTLVAEMQTDDYCDDLFQQSVIHYVYSISYAAQRTRPDVLFPINIMATVVSSPPKCIIKHMDRTFGYLSNTVNKGIILGAKGTALTVMADASYGIHRDGKSHSGVIVFMDNNMLLAKSVKQKLVVVSSTEAEMECLTEGLKQLQPIKKLLEELQLLVDNKTIIQQDNKSTMRLAKRGEGFDGKSRHMRVRYHYIAEQVSKGEIDIQYLETTKMVADLLSKPGGSSNFSELVQSIVKNMPDI